ncbi:MAG TPA: DUF1028 domain-containing protein [Ignavibacteriaceae bacterium]|nr:DUF1028 domain-containing protein [Ignavibacteriaceae bacterium]
MKTRLIFIIAVIASFFVADANAQLFYSKNPLAHTFSIVARDPDTGEMGVAVQSHWFSVGTSVTWGEAGVGVVATQSFVNPSFGPRGLALLKNGLTAKQAVDMLIKNDEGRDVRQLAICDSKGNVAAWTGKKCIQPAGDIQGNEFSCQANLMSTDQVWPSMANAFNESKGQPLAERMIAALEAGQAAGGDIRGRQSAALLVVKAKSTGKIWEDREIDLRVDDSDHPIQELKRLVKLHRAYDHMNAGDLAVEHNDMKLAMKEYSTAESMFPDNAEMKFWHAVTLTNIGKLDEALPIFKEVFAMDKNWAALTPRLIGVGQLNVDDAGLKKILAQQ